MYGIELVKFKIYKYNKIKSLNYVEVNSITTIVGNNGAKQRELFELLKWTNSFLDTTKEFMSFSKKVNKKELEIILEYKCNNKIFERIKGILNTNEKLIDNSIKIVKMKNEKYVINLFEMADEIKIDDSSKMQIIDILKSNIPIFKEVKYEYYNNLSDFKFDSSDILIFENLEKYCMSNNIKVNDFIEKYISDNKIIHSTTSPYIVDDKDVEAKIIDSDNFFGMQTLNKIRNNFNYEIKTISISMIISLIILMYRFYYYLELKKFDLSKIDLDILAQASNSLGKEVLLVFFVCIFIIIILNCFLPKEGIFKKTIWASFTGPIMLLIVILNFIMPVGMALITVSITTLIIFVISLIVYNLIGEFLLFLVNGLVYIKNNFNIFSIQITAKGITNENYFLYMIALIFIIFLPYITELSVFITKKIYSYFNKPLAESSVRIISKLFNVKTIRIILYIIAFFIYVIMTVIAEEYRINIIKEAFVSWIILDVALFSIYNHFEENSIKIKKISRLKFARRLLSIFNESLLEKNKFQMMEIFSKFMNSTEFSKYFKSSRNIRVDKEMLYNKDYFDNILFRIFYFNKKSILTDTEFKKYIEELVEIVKNKEIDILSE